MLNGLKPFERHFVRLLAASITAGFLLQAQWAMEHDFELFDARVFATALVLFGLLLAIRALCRRVVPDKGEHFDAQYTESVWLLAVVPAFFIVENTFLRIVGLVVYLAVIARYIAVTLNVAWLRRVVEETGDAVRGLLRTAAGPAVAYRVQDDRGPRVLRVSVVTRGDAAPSASALRRAVAGLYRDLPDAERFDAVRVNVDGVGRIDGTLSLLLEPLAHYAALGNLGKVAIVSRRDRQADISKVVAAERFSVEAGDG